MTLENSDAANREELLERFESLMRHVAESHTPEFLDVDVTMSQAKLLYLVSLRPGVTMSVIASKLGVGAPAVSGLVDRLVALGYIERRAGDDDRRQHLVTITESGAAVLDQMRELRTEVMRRLLHGLGSHEFDALRISLIALDREVQRLEAPGSPTQAQPERTSS